MRRLKEIMDWLNRQLLGYAQLFLATLLLCSISFGQTPQNVPDSAKHEIERRGNMVQQTGTIRSGLIAAAFATPADDSEKWFITLVVKPGDEDSQTMKTVCSQAKEMKAWIDANSSQASPTIYHVREWDLNGTQKDWLQGLIPAVEKHGLPVIVVQPPRSGKFGSCATIVKLLHGTYSGKQLSDKIREGMITYINTIDEGQQLAGIRAERPYTEKPQTPVEGPPPFNVPSPKAEPARVNPPANLPFEWPQPKPEALTVDQIKQACPDASPEFILETIASKETNQELIKLRWLVNQSKQPKTPETPRSYEHDEPESEAVPKPDFFHDTPTMATIAAVLVLLWWAASKAGRWAAEKVANFAAALATVQEMQKNQTQIPSPVAKTEGNSGTNSANAGG